MYTNFINSIQQSPIWEANSSSSSQEIFLPFTELEGSLPYPQEPSTALVPIEMNPAHTVKSFFLKLYRNIISPSPFRFIDFDFICISPHFHLCYTLNSRNNRRYFNSNNTNNTTTTNNNNTSRKLWSCSPCTFLPSPLFLRSKHCL
jgi:hypothetical protein